MSRFGPSVPAKKARGEKKIFRTTPARAQGRTAVPQGAGPRVIARQGPARTSGKIRRKPRLTFQGPHLHIPTFGEVRDSMMR
jgi:hypothetical protein